MKRVISATLVMLIAFSLILVPKTYMVQGAGPPTLLVQNINTGLSYTTIQAAIDDSLTLNGQTLLCAAGNYTESVQVYKSLTIVGAGPTLSGISPYTSENDTFSITARNVTLEGFTIQSAPKYFGVARAPSPR